MATRNRNYPELTPAQEAAAVALAAGSTIEDAARKCGRAAVTVKMWRRENPRFNERVVELRAEMTARTVGLLCEGMTYAAMVLRTLLTSGTESIKLRAAEALLNHGLRVREASEFEARLAALEAKKGKQS